MNVGKYYVAGIPFDSENSLKHYGVKGMEWDKHKFGLDADTRFIKWLDPNKVNVGSYGKYGKMAEAAAKQKYGDAVPHSPRPVTTYNKQQVMDHAKRMQQNMAQKKWSNSPIGKASNFVTGTANRAGKAIGTAANAVGNWAGQQAKNVGNTVGQAAQDVGKWAGQQAQNVDQSLNITGNKDRADAERFRGYADKTNSQFNKDYWTNRANESQNRADSSLVGRATAAGNAVGQAARNVGNAVSGAANAVGDWAGQQAQNVANSAPIKAVGDFIDQNITGNTDRESAQAYRDIARDLATTPEAIQRLEDRANAAQAQADNSLFGRVGNAANAVGQAAQNVANSAPVQAVGQAARDVGDWASNAARDVGNWAGQAAQDVGGAVSGAAQNVGSAIGQAADQARGGIGGFFDRVGNAVSGAANAVGDWAGQQAQNVGNTVGQAAKNVGEFVDNKLNLSGNQAQADADRYRNLSNQASGQTSKDYWDSKAAEAQQNADNSLAGRAKGFLNSAGQWVSGAANSISNAARGVGGAVSGAANKATEGAKGFINSAGKWVSNAAGNVGQAAKNVGGAISGAADNVGDFARNLPGNVADAARGVKDFVDYRVTGAGYDRISPDNPEVQEAIKNISRSNSTQLSVDPNITGFSMEPRMVYSPEEAMQYMQEAADTGRSNSLFGRVGNAAGAVGDWARNVPGNIAGAARDVGGAISGAANSVGDWARNVPGNVSNFVDQNITGNSARAEANRYNTFAQNPNMDSVQQLMNQRAAENAQARADNSLFGRVGNAANAVGDWTSNAARDVGGAVSGAARGVGDWAGQQAQNIGNAVSGAARGAGDWASNVPGNISNWAGQAAQNVSNIPQNVANWYTGQPNADRAEAIDRQVQDYERLGDMMYRQGMQAQGDRYHQLAANLGSVADANQARYEAAPQQRLTAAGQWIGDQVSSVPGNIADWWNRRNPFVQHSAFDEKPDGVSDAFWEKFTADGGTREDYERDWR